jgi:hypothetical protein
LPERVGARLSRAGKRRSPLRRDFGLASRLISAIDSRYIGDGEEGNIR